jgi:ABC-2 type transport system permease protein
MRLFAEERKLGTIELLWTYPVRDVQLILGKFLAAWGFFAVLLALAALPFFVFYLQYPFAPLPAMAGFLGLGLLGTAFLACGVAASTFTENQMVAAMVTYGILVFFWFLTWNEGASSEGVMRFLLLLSLFDRYYNFCLGMIDTRDVVYFIAFSAFFLFMGLRVLQSRAWRGVD